VGDHHGLTAAERQPHVALDGMPGALVYAHNVLNVRS
jgi:hypothetical protein